MNWLEKTFLRVTGRGSVVAEYEASIDRMMKIRRRATQLWLADGRHVPCNCDAIHAFMVSYPPTRVRYERMAREEQAQ